MVGFDLFYTDQHKFVLGE